MTRLKRYTYSETFFDIDGASVLGSFTVTIDTSLVKDENGPNPYGILRITSTGSLGQLGQPQPSAESMPNWMYRAACVTAAAILTPICFTMSTGKIWVAPEEGGPVKPWEFVESESSHDYGIFKTRVDHLRSPRTQHVLRRVMVEPPDWVNVVARTVDGNFLMVRQIRHGIAAPSLEIPAGAIEANESPAQAAARELLEETGYQAATLHELGRVFPNPAFQTNTCYLYLADHCHKVQRTRARSRRGHPSGDLDPRPVARGQPGTDRIQHSLVIAALYFLREQENGWA